MRREDTHKYEDKDLEFIHKTIGYALKEYMKLDSVPQVRLSGVGNYKPRLKALPRLLSKWTEDYNEGKLHKVDYEYRMRKIFLIANTAAQKGVMPIRNKMYINALWEQAEKSGVDIEKYSDVLEHDFFPEIRVIVEKARKAKKEKEDAANKESE